MFNRWNAHRLADRARDVFDDTRELASEGATQAGSFIHAKPVAAALIGVGAGIAAGMIFGSFRRLERPAAPEPRRPRTPKKSRKSARS